MKSRHSHHLLQAVLGTLLLSAGVCHAVCDHFATDSSLAESGIVGGFAYAAYKTDKLQAWMYGDVCWTAADITDENNYRIFFLPAKSYDANGHIADFQSVDDTARSIFACPSGSRLSAADNLFRPDTTAKVSTLVCRKG